MAVTQYEYYYDDFDFDTWVPKLLIEDVNDRAGQVITAEHWNELWNVHKEQGDYNSKTIDEMLRKLNQSVWNTTDSLAMLYHKDPTNAETAGDSVSEQLDWALENTEALLPVIEDDDGVRFIKATAFEPVTYTTEVTLADHTLEAILTYLKALHEELSSRVDDISVGTLEAFNHNDIGGRNAAGAHTTTAIAHGSVSLSAHLASVADDFQRLNTSLLTTTGRVNTHTNTEGSKHDAANISVMYDDNTSNVQAAISSLNIRIRQITGDVKDITSLDIKHANLPDIATSGHSADVITLINSRYNTVQEALTDFRKIHAGTAAPTSSLGSDGDIYIQYT